MHIFCIVYQPIKRLSAFSYVGFFTRMVSSFHKLFCYDAELIHWGPSGTVDCSALLIRWIIVVGILIIYATNSWALNGFTSDPLLSSRKEENIVDVLSTNEDNILLVNSDDVRLPCVVVEVQLNERYKW